MNDYLPGAVQDPQPGGVTLDTSLPARFVWHITWDQLRADGSQPDIDAVDSYLQSKQYCPNIIWNPFTGYVKQYYPASLGGRALAYNNQDGAVCVQVEVFFTPGCVVDGIRYATVADTPLNGWAEILAWADSLGVPRTWPMGAPQWQNNSRDVGTWNSQAGHYGHCNSPGDTHTDPGPMPDLNRSTVTTQGTITPVQEDELSAAEVAAIIDATQKMHDVTRQHLKDTIPGLSAAATVAQPIPYKDPVTGADTAQTTTLGTVAGYTDFQHNATRTSLPAAVLNQAFTLPDGTVTNLAGILTAIHAQPVTAGTVVNATDPQAIADAVLSGIKTQWSK